MMMTMMTTEVLQVQIVSVKAEWKTSLLFIKANLEKQLKHTIRKWTTSLKHTIMFNMETRLL